MNTLHNDKSKHAVVTHYTMNDEYGGHKYFAFGLNFGLRTQAIDFTTDQQEALKEMDACFLRAPREDGILTLYRGASLYANSPVMLDANALRFNEFLSTSLDVATACRFADSAEAWDGNGCVFKISYARHLPHVNISRGNDEEEVILPRGLVFRKVTWLRTEVEKLKISTSMYKGYTHFMGLEVMDVNNVK